MSVNQPYIDIQDSEGYLRYHFAVTLQAEGKIVKIDAPRLSSKFYGKCTDGLDCCTRQTSSTYTSDYGEITWQRAFEQKDSTSFRLQLTFKNLTKNPVYLRKLSPFVIEGPDSLQIGPKNGQWQIYRQGRHKNDLPAVCNLSQHDENYNDAQRGLSETGGSPESPSEPANLFVSDQTTVIRNSTGNYLFLGYLTGAEQMVSSTLEMDSKDVFQRLESSCIINCLVEPGETVSSEWLQVERNEEHRMGILKAIRTFAENKARLYCVRRKEPAPSVYCTWYYYGLTVSYQDVKENLDLLSQQKIPFDVFQIDEGWERVLGDWNPNSRFPLPMSQVAEEIQEAGYLPGIWTSPFIAHETAPVAFQHPEWLLRHLDGTLCRFPMNNTTYCVLDITNPEVLEWIRGLYITLRQWGYVYHKLDFTRAPVVQENAVFYNQNIPLAKAYRLAIQAVRDGLGNDAYLLICGGLYDPVIGLADAQRTGSDTLSMWSKTIQAGGRAAPFTMKQNLLRSWMNLWWNNDPDALMVRRQDEPFRGLALGYGLLTDVEAKTSTLNQYIGGGLVCSTEPMAKIDRDRLMLLSQIMPVVPTEVFPRDLFGGGRYPSIIDVEVKKKGWHTVAFINWSDSEPLPCALALNSYSLGDFAEVGKIYTLCEYYSGQVVEDVQYGDTVALNEIPPHGCALVKVMEQNPNRPQIVKSNGHLSFGGETECFLCKKGHIVFQVNWKFARPVSYTVRLPQNFRPKSELLPKYVSYHCPSHSITIELPGRGEYRIVF